MNKNRHDKAILGQQMSWNSTLVIREQSLLLGNENKSNFLRTTTISHSKK